MKTWMIGLLLWILPSAAFAAPLKVVATLPSLAALAAEVGGPLVQVEALSSPRQDPHYVDARPSLILQLNRADMLVQNGLELEVGWLPPLLLQARNPKISPGAPGFFDASQHVHLLQVPLGAVSRRQGDIHPGGNPHFLFDPRAAASIAEALGQRLAEVDAAHAETYRNNAAVLVKRLRALAAEEAAKFAALPAAKRRLCVYHESLVYVLDWLGLQEVATVEPRPGIPPDPQHVAAVLQTMRGGGVHVLAQEEFYPQNTSKTLAELAKARLVVLPGGTRFSEGQHYADHARALADTLFAAFSQAAP